MQELLKKIKDEAAGQGVKNFEIYLERQDSLNLAVKEQKVDSLDRAGEMGFGFRVASAYRTGFSYGTDFSPGGIRTVIGAAVSGSLQTSPDSAFAFTPHPSGLSPLKLWDDRVDRISLKDKITTLMAMEEAAFNEDRRIKRVRYNSCEESKKEVWLSNSLGLELSFRKTWVDYSLMAVAEEGDESEMAHDTIGSSFYGRLDPSALAKKVAREAASRLGGSRCPNYRGPVVLAPSVAVDMLGVLSPSALSEQIHKKNSFLIGKKGQKIYSPLVSLVDDGRKTEGEKASPFDDEGVPRQRTEVIRQGVVGHFLYDGTWARREGVSSTGNAHRSSFLSRPRVAVSNFYLEPGNHTSEEIMKKAGEGITVSEVIGMHTADAISGDFSVGIQGHRITNGKKGEPIRSVALTGNLHDLFSKIGAVGSDLRFYGATGAPTVLVTEASVSGE